MKTIFCYLLITLSIYSCTGQKRVVEGKNKDIIVFEFEDDNVKSIKNEHILKTGLNTEIYNKNRVIIITQKWHGYGSERFDKTYSFEHLKDTMNIYCSWCGQEANFNIKNIKFNKGNYELVFEIPETENTIKGLEIQVDDEFKKTIFKDAYKWKKTSTTFSNTIFEDLDFYKISLNDKGVVIKKRNQ